MQGTINNHNKYRLIRGDKIIQLDIKITSLKQNKENAYLIREGEECGIIFENIEEPRVGDLLDCYETNPQYEGILNTQGVIECY